MKQLEIQILGKTPVTFEYWGIKFFRLTTSLNVSRDIIIDSRCMVKIFSFLFLTKLSEPLYLKLLLTILFSPLNV